MFGWKRKRELGNDASHLDPNTMKSRFVLFNRVRHTVFAYCSSICTNTAGDVIILYLFPTVHVITLLLSLSLSLSISEHPQNTLFVRCRTHLVLRTYIKKYTHHIRVKNLVLRCSRQYGTLTNRVTDTTHVPKYTHAELCRKLDANTNIRTNSYYNSPWYFIILLTE